MPARYVGINSTFEEQRQVINSLSEDVFSGSGIGGIGSDKSINTTGIITASSFSGALQGNASTATQLQTTRTFEIAGDVAASPVNFNGTGNVTLTATIQPNSIDLGTDTVGDYVQSITGTSNQITITGGTGEGSTPIISLSNSLTAPQDLAVTRDLQVNRNLNVDGNITIGGTSATLFATEFKVYDPDIVLGIRTDSNGNDVSNDTTANHGGIAIASTEGTPLVQLYDVGVGETNPATYKKIMWFKSGAFAGLNTDAWLINYAVGIGSTQLPVGTRLAAGSVQFTENDLTVVRNINSSGIVTASSFRGSLVGTATSTTNIPNLTGDVTSNNTVTTLATVNNNVGTFGSSSAIPSITVNAKGLVTGVTTNAITVGNGILTLDTSGIGLSGSQSFSANQSGNSTFTVTSNATSDNTNGTLVSRNSLGGFSAGIVTATLLNVGSGATVISTISNGNVGIGTTNPQYKLDVNGDINFTGSFRQNGSQFIASRWTSGIGDDIYRLNGDVGIGTTNPQYKLDVDGDINFTGSFRQNGSLFIASRWTSGIGDDIYKLNGDVGIGTTNPTSKLQVIGDINATSFSGSGSNLTGIVTYITAGNGISINQSTGNVTINSIVGSQIRNNNNIVGTAITVLNFTGTGISTVTSSSGIATITIPGSSRTVNTYIATAGQTTFSATYTVGYVDVYLNGSKLSQSEYTATNGTSIVLIEGASLSDIVEIVSYNLILSSNQATGGYADTAGTSTNVSGGLGSLTNLNVSGITTLGSSNGIGTVTVGVGTTALLVQGNTRITGTLSIGNSSIVLDGNADTFRVGTGVTITGSGQIQASSISVGGNTVTTVGVGIRTSGGTVGTGVTLLDLRGAGISTVTVSSGIATINVTGGGGGGTQLSISTVAPSNPTDGQLWWDSDDGNTYIWYASQNVWVVSQTYGY